MATTMTDITAANKDMRTIASMMGITMVIEAGIMSQANTVMTTF